jgi:rare lipoprotein A
MKLPDLEWIDDWASAVWAGILMAICVCLLAAFYILASTAWTVAFGAERGLASVYSEGPQTASGERFSSRAMCAAHRTLPFGTRVRVHHGQRSAVVTINDRGPWIRGRIIDLTPIAARVLAISGLAPVTLEVLR